MEFEKLPRIHLCTFEEIQLIIKGFCKCFALELHLLARCHQTDTFVNLQLSSALTEIQLWPLADTAAMFVLFVA